jgi:hypothetical protein
MRWGKCWLGLCRADVGFWPEADWSYLMWYLACKPNAEK